MSAYTEADAITHWCFLYLSSREPHTSPNWTPCKASRCMAWRWQTDKNNQPLDTGYCGLAGIVPVPERIVSLPPLPILPPIPTPYPYPTPEPVD